MNHQITLTRGDREGFEEFTDIFTNERNNKIIIWFEGDICGRGVQFGFGHPDPDAYFEILDIEEPVGSFESLELYDAEQVHPDTHRMTYIIVTDQGRYPICIFQHESINVSTQSIWKGEVGRDWESIL
jgi:hypothetical protein